MRFHRNDGIVGKPVLAGLLAAFLWGVLSVPVEAAQGMRLAAADFSGVEKFLELTAILEQDKEPAPEQWDALFTTPGYAVLIKRDFQREFFVERFKLAFMPSRAEALSVQMKKDTGFRAQFLPHYLRVKEKREEIRRWAVGQKADALYVEAMEKARRLLPEGTVVDPPSVAFVVFAPDSRGYDPVVLDILDCMDKGGRLADLVGHEFHHYYRNRLVDLNQDQATLWVIGQIHGEGTR